MFTSGNAETVAMVQELIGRANAAMVNALNIGAEKILERAQVEVPKSEHHQPRPGDPSYPPESLEERARVVRATPESMRSHVVYPGPYAGAQEVGRMVYERKDREVPWVAEHYTASGTKAHYLEDAGKSILGEMEEELALQGHIAFGDLPGFLTTPQAMRTAGRREEALPPPSGELGQIASKETLRAESTSALTEVPGGHPPILQ